MVKRMLDCLKRFYLRYMILCLFIGYYVGCITKLIFNEDSDCDIHKCLRPLCNVSYIKVEIDNIENTTRKVEIENTEYMTRKDEIENNKYTTENIHNKTSYLTWKDEYIEKYRRINADVPVGLLKKRKDYSCSNNCTKLPDFINLKFKNIYWQTLKLPNSTVYLYRAYYDNRNLIAPVIRIIITSITKYIHRIKYCQIWFPSEKLVVISNKTNSFHMDDLKVLRPLIHSYTFTCKIPSEYKDQIPGAVSLVASECDTAINLLKVNYNLPESGNKEDFAICLKALLYPEEDMSYYILQYIELAKLLGIHKVFIYDYIIHPNMRAVIRYYELQGRVELIPFTYPTVVNLPAPMERFVKYKEGRHKEGRYVGEGASRNDCFLRNIHRYKYTAIFDMDEIMIPSDGKTWKESIDGVIKREKEEKGNRYVPPSSYRIPMGFYPDSLRDHWTPGIPQYMSMLQNVNRTYTLQYFKQIVATDNNNGVSGHIQQKCIGKCIIHNLKHSEGYLNHYRHKKSCNSKRYKTNCARTFTDTRIWHHKEDLMKNVDAALKSIGLLK